MYIDSPYYYLALKSYYDDLRNTRIKIGEKTFYIITYEVGKFHLTPSINKYRNINR